MPHYNTELADPPAPYTMALIRHPETNQFITDVPMLLDTGSDISLVPRATAVALNADEQQIEGVRLIGYNGNASNAVMVRLHIVFEGRTFRGAWMLTDGDYGIIGRDILNLLSIHLDGPNHVWSIRNP